MGENSKIEWTDSTWSPIRARNLATGKIGWHCEHVSEACRNCYAESINRRLGTGLDFKPGRRADIEIFLDEKMLMAPLRWKKPRRIFVNSMTDTFAEFVEERWIDRMFATMGACEEKGLGHQFQILTKRPERMLGYMKTRAHEQWNSCRLGREAFPPRNAWFGVSAEDQATADERIPLLLQTPAAVRFVSLEPLLGPIDLEYPEKLFPGGPKMCCDGRECGCMGRPIDPPLIYGIDLVIVGGESGPHARPMHPQWARSLRDQCAAADVPFFFKQWGEWHVPNAFEGHENIGPTTPFVRVGKKTAGRLLDGVEHNGLPGIGAARL